MCLAVDLIRGLSLIVAEMTGAELKSRFAILACRQHSQHRRAIARFGHYTFAEVILISGQEKMVSPVSVVSINLGIWFYEVETGDTGESIEPKESQQRRGFPIKVRKQVGDVVQLVRTLPCHRLPKHNRSGIRCFLRKAQLTPINFHLNSQRLLSLIKMPACDAGGSRSESSRYAIFAQVLHSRVYGNAFHGLYR